MKEVLQENKNEELLEEAEKEKRRNNFIIHGLAECGEDGKSDESIVEQFFNTIRITPRPAKFYRLGKADQNENKSRPLKIEMTSSDDKDTVMNHLNHLKGDDDLGKISVKDDLTRNERDQVKRFINNAKEQTQASEDFRFVVRGSPKNGLWLKKVPKRVPN